MHQLKLVAAVVIAAVQRARRALGQIASGDDSDRRATSPLDGMRRVGVGHGGPPSHLDQAATAARARRSPPVAAAGAGREVLVVEDHDDLRDLLAEGLEAHGFRVRVAANGADGLSALHLHHQLLSVVLLDLGLAEVNGFEFLVQQAADPALDAVPVIVVSGRSEIDESHRPRAWVHTIRKPVELASVIDAIRRFGR